ncbi:response regulator transcription factor [Christensenella tenuis]|jgi:two-component system, OmpR family, response regulator ResD|uniref:Stage 0 sporulation protein A homolog n=1 Tax=Christensenella tenuis TaxID=2763033 RepID=A0ABR7EEX1_9FIRM|nr:response regulator transcription factor [Christensenella tenuis]MBC5647713.1 response regulator transcription factor [Christensenella tenuis]
MQKLLIVDDDPYLRSLVRTYAENEEFECLEAENGRVALDIAGLEPIDIIVLDIMMPEMGGYEALAKLRESSDVPVILLTARSEEYDKLYGFNLGADDYVPKPFSPKELMARVKAVLKRGRAIQDESLEFGLLKIGKRSHLVTVNEETVILTPKEFDLLIFLAENPNIVMDRDTLLKKVWGYDYFGDSRTVDTHIKSLRDRLGNCRKMIKTVWGVGYKFEYEA